MSGYTEDLETYEELCRYFKVSVKYINTCADVYGHGMELWNKFRTERASKIWRQIRPEETFDDGHED